MQAPCPACNTSLSGDGFLRLGCPTPSRAARAAARRPCRLASLMASSRPINGAPNVPLPQSFPDLAWRRGTARHCAVQSVDSASSVAVVRLTAMRACLPGCPICPTACQIAHLPGTAPLLPALACCVRLSNRPPRGPGPRSAMQRQGGRGSRHNRGPACPSSPTARPARSRRRHRSRSEDRPLSTHWSRC